ncbi:MAG: DUF5615 family PIN-like protein [Candidatus Sungbacteria bacterium]|nr:DUF5615 family PIN-like protein [Candidatus Sungbacteria bacterium]
MNIVIDEDLQRSLGEVLQKLGHDVFDVRDHGLRGKSDKEVFHFAQEKSAVLFSGDLGFSNIFQFPLGSHAGIVILRFPNEMPTSAINVMVLASLTLASEEDLMGNLVVISPGKVRIRRRYNINATQEYEGKSI